MSIEAKALNQLAPNWQKLLFGFMNQLPIVTLHREAR